MRIFFQTGKSVPGASRCNTAIFEEYFRHYVDAGHQFSGFAPWLKTASGVTAGDLYFSFTHDGEVLVVGRVTNIVRGSDSTTVNTDTIKRIDLPGARGFFWKEGQQSRVLRLVRDNKIPLFLDDPVEAVAVEKVG